MKKVISALLTIAMMQACMASAFAASTPEESTSVPQEMTAVLGEPIGTLTDDEGGLIESRTSTSGGLPFTMTANKVSGLLTTYSSSGKNFTGGCLNGLKGHGVKVKGTVTHSLGYNVKVGACYYQPDNDTFYSVYPVYFDSGVESIWWIPKVSGYSQYFFNNETYYGHITNHNHVGTVSGSLTFSISADPG